MKKLSITASVIALILFLGTIILRLSHVQSYITTITLICAVIFLALGTITYMRQK